MAGRIFILSASVSTGRCSERIIFIYQCDDRLYVFDETPPVCRTFSETQALRKLPCRFTAEYTHYDGALVFRDIASEDIRQRIIQTIIEVCRERGLELDRFLHPVETEG